MALVARTGRKKMMNKLLSYFPGGIPPEKKTGRRKYFFKYQTSIVVFLLFLIVSSLIYQICTGVYGLLLNNRRLKKERLVLQEKKRLIEDLEAKIKEEDLNQLLKLEAEEFRNIHLGE